MTTDGDFSDWPFDRFTEVARQPLFPQARDSAVTDAVGDHLLLEVDRVGFFNNSSEDAFEETEDFGAVTYFAHDGAFLHILTVAIDDTIRDDRDTTEFGSSGFLNDGFEFFIALLIAILAFISRRRSLIQNAELQASDRRQRSALEAVVGSSLDAIITTDHEGRISDFNPSAEEMFGYERAEVLGKTVVDTIAPASEIARHRLNVERVITKQSNNLLGKRLGMNARRRNSGQGVVVNRDPTTSTTSRPTVDTTVCRDAPRTTEARCHQQNPTAAASTINVANICRFTISNYAAI